MYPYLRFLKAIVTARRQPPLGPFEPHVSRHICWPTDIDPWREMNNGRTLTLYDLGRAPMALRMGMMRALQAHGFGMTIAGSSVRYRMRVRMFERVTMVSRVLGWDQRFFYIEQSMWKGRACTSQILLRSAVTQRGAKGMVDPQHVVDAIAPGTLSPALPGWVAAWIAAEAERPWPPEAERFLPAK